MGTYKVIQDIEADDKLFGPFSLRQFVYLIIVIVSLFIGFKLATSVKWYLAVPLLPHTVFFAMLAAPFGHDQSTEVWMLAKLRFMLKPRKRIWDQSGIKELVTITVPKKIEKHLTDGFSQTEVRSRLQALANTIDTRGWATKNVSASAYNQQFAYATNQDSDRLIDVSAFAPQAAVDDTPSGHDILDEYSNPAYQSISQKMQSSEQAHHQQLVAMMQSAQTAVAPTASQPQAPVTPVDQQWFTQPSAQAPYPSANPVQQLVPAPMPMMPQPAQVPQNIQPQPMPLTPVANQLPESQIPQASSMTVPTDTAILELARNDDLDVATIARQADKAFDQGNNEVVVSLR